MWSLTTDVRIIVACSDPVNQTVSFAITPKVPFFTYLYICGMHFKYTTASIFETWHSAHTPSVSACRMCLLAPVPPTLSLLLRSSRWIC